LADLTTLTDDEFIDWGQQEKFATAIGVGECAGVMIDLVATLILEAEEKIGNSEECILNNAYADSIYHAYSAQINAAKALLLQKGVQCNTQHGILNDFDKTFTETGLFTLFTDLRSTVLRMNDHTPDLSFANEYLQQAKAFIRESSALREKLINQENQG
jgi:sulfite reductase (ferredoxin)